LPDFIGGAYATSAAAMARGRRGSWGGTRALGFRLGGAGGEKWRRRVLGFEAPVEAGFM
jgi:hypothetical protein